MHVADTILAEVEQFLKFRCRDPWGTYKQRHHLLMKELSDGWKEAERWGNDVKRELDTIKNKSAEGDATGGYTADTGSTIPCNGPITAEERSLQDHVFRLEDERNELRRKLEEALCAHANEVCGMKEKHDDTIRKMSFTIDALKERAHANEACGMNKKYNDILQERSSVIDALEKITEQLRLRRGTGNS